MSLINPAEKPLGQQRCQTIEKGSKPLIIPVIESHLSQLNGWEAPIHYREISQTFIFKNHLQVISFVNAVAWISNQEDHYPTTCFDYNTAKITLSTQDIKGLSLNDIILAAKINALLAEKK